MKITNTQPGPRGLNTVNGPVLLDVGQTLDDVKVYVRERQHIEAAGWFKVEGDYTANPRDKDAPAPASADTGEIDRLKAELAAKDIEIATLKGASDSSAPGAYAVLDKNGGWYAVTLDGKEVTKSLRKDDVKDFDALSAADKAAFVDLHKPE